MQARQRVKEFRFWFWFWFWFRCVLYIHMQCGHGIPECPAYGYVLCTEDVGKIGGTGNMGSMVDIWGNEKKKERQEVWKRKIKSPLCGRISRGWENGDGDGLLLRRVSFLVGPDPAREIWRDREKIDGMGDILLKDGK